MMPFSQIVSMVEGGGHLSREQSRDAFEQIMSGAVEPEPMGAFLKALAARGETVDEIVGAADVMNDKVTRVHCGSDCVDTCGTGGDGISTFNVSTASAIIAAAGGATVAKHGNYTNTRVSGSAEAMRELGVNLEADVPTLERCLRGCRVAFLFAPRLHPAMKHAAPVRKQLGIRTIFNLLGPLTNPAGARRQVLGVSREDLTDKLAQVLAARRVSHAWVVHGSDGLCDLTITGETRVTEVRRGEIRTFTVHPRDVGLETGLFDELRVESAAESAAVIRRILTGADQGARRSHAVLNAAAALVVAGLTHSLEIAVGQAQSAIDSGQAARTLEQLAELSHGPGESSKA